MRPSAKFGRLPPLERLGGGGMGAITGYCTGGTNAGCNVTFGNCWPNLLQDVKKKYN
jgi:hypothetical protein